MAIRQTVQGTENLARMNCPTFLLLAAPSWEIVESNSLLGKIQRLPNQLLIQYAPDRFSIMSEPAIQYIYDPDNSFAVDRSPIEDGWYGALLDDGLTAVAHRHGGQWLLDDGPIAGRTVQRYSGYPVQVDAERWPVLFDSIRSAWPPANDHEARQTVRKAALSLARHCAWHREHAPDAEIEVADAFRLCLFYRVALACGEVLAEGTADAGIFHFYWESQTPEQRSTIERLLLLSPEEWPSMFATA